MCPIQIVSVDLFNTLLDLSSERHILWQTFLGETSTPARIQQGWELTSQALFNALDQMNATSKYQSLCTVFQACYTEVAGDFDAKPVGVGVTSGAGAGDFSDGAAGKEIQVRGQRDETCVGLFCSHCGRQIGRSTRCARETPDFVRPRSVVDRKNDLPWRDRAPGCSQWRLDCVGHLHDQTMFL